MFGPISAALDALDPLATVSLATATVHLTPLTSVLFGISVHPTVQVAVVGLFGVVVAGLIDIKRDNRRDHDNTHKALTGLRESVAELTDRAQDLRDVVLDARGEIHELREGSAQRQQQIVAELDEVKSRLLVVEEIVGVVAEEVAAEA